MPKVLFSERELEDFLSVDNNLCKYTSLKFIARQVPTESGYLDILAYDRAQKVFVLIELKKQLLDFDAYKQVHRYWYDFNKKYNANPLKKRRRFIRLLVGTHLHEELFYMVGMFNGGDYSCSYPSASNQYQTYYTLYDLQFDSGISFSWHNINQLELEEEVYNPKLRIA